MHHLCGDLVLSEVHGRAVVSRMKESKMPTLFVLMLLAFSGALTAGIITTDVADEGGISAASVPSGAIPVANTTDLAIIGSGLTYGGYVWSLSAYYYQTDNITLTGVNNHTPIGTESNPFTGTFDGNAFTISGLNISRSETVAYVGLFGFALGANFVNIGIQNSVVSGSATGGGLADMAFVGAICGRANESTISNCYNTGQVSAFSNRGNPYAGGLIGGLFGTSVISHCYNTGNITAARSGYFSAAGGLFGTAEGWYTTIDSVTLNDCYNTGNISSRVSGGLIGTNLSAYITYTVNRCYNTGNISGDGSSASGAGTFAHRMGDGVTINVNNSFRLDTATLSANKTTAQGTALTAAQMQNQSSFVGWNFSAVWTMDNSFPQLRWSAVPLIWMNAPNNVTTTSDKALNIPISASDGVTVDNISYGVAMAGGTSWLSFSGGSLRGTTPVPDQSPKTWTFTVTASKAGFASITHTFSVTVFEETDTGNVPEPVIDVTHISGRTYSFDASRSSDNTNITWNFGDGATSSDLIVQHTFVQSGAFTISLSITNSDGTGTTDTKLVIYDAEPLTTAYRGVLYRTTLSVPSLVGISFSSTASWLQLTSSGADPNGGYYAIMEGVPPEGSGNQTYDASLTAGTNFPWKVTVQLNFADTTAFFTLFKVEGGKVTVRNNSSNAVVFTWYWDALNSLAIYNTTGDPSGYVDHIYTASGDYTIRLKATGTQVDYHEVMVSVVVNQDGGGGGNDGDDEDEGNGIDIGMIQVALFVMGVLVLIAGSKFGLPVVFVGAAILALTALWRFFL